MTFTNVTTITEFIIAGFPGLEPRYYRLISLLFLGAYLAIVTGNGFIVIIILMERCLQKPPYLIFCNLAVSEIVSATAILPKVITLYWAEDNIISFSACFLQMFIFQLFQFFICFLMMIMALDRYIAICNPLRYQALIKNSTILTLCGLSWLISITMMVILLVQSLSLPYCNSNVVSHCFCYNVRIITLACEKVNAVQTSVFMVAVIAMFGPLIFIIFSYATIIVSVIKITSWEGRYKMFSTCSPQLFTICLYYIPRGFSLLATIINFKFNADMRILITMLSCFLPPIVNPFIYCLRTKEIKDALMRRLDIIKLRASFFHS